MVSKRSVKHPAVQEGIINEIGGISQAIAKLHELIDAKKR